MQLLVSVCEERCVFLCLTHAPSHAHSLSAKFANTCTYLRAPGCKSWARRTGLPSPWRAGQPSCGRSQTVHHLTTPLPLNLRLPLFLLPLTQSACFLLSCLRCVRVCVVFGVNPKNRNRQPPLHATPIPKVTGAASDDKHADEAICVLLAVWLCLHACVFRVHCNHERSMLLSFGRSRPGVSTRCTPVKKFPGPMRANCTTAISKKLDLSCMLVSDWLVEAYSNP